MIDYSFKSKIVSSQLFQDYKYNSKLVYKYVFTDFNDLVMYQRAQSNLIFLIKNFPKEYKECIRISNAHCKRVVRLKNRMADMVFNHECLFLTLTFTDSSLSRLSPEVRKKYVKEYLSSYRVPYIANIDFGKKNGREHYHAVIQVSKVDYSLWKYGSINGIKIRNNTEDLTRIARYVAKLTNHAIKETNKRSVIIYGRFK